MYGGLPATPSQPAAPVLVSQGNRFSASTGANSSALRGPGAQDSATAAGWLDNPRTGLAHPAGQETGHRRRGVVAAADLVRRRRRLPRERLHGTRISGFRAHLRTSESAIPDGSRNPAGSAG